VTEQVETIIVGGGWAGLSMDLQCKSALQLQIQDYIPLVYHFWIPKIRVSLWRWRRCSLNSLYNRGK